MKNSHKPFFIALLMLLCGGGFAQTPGEILPYTTYQQVEKALARDLDNHKANLSNQLEAEKLAWNEQLNEKVLEVREASFRIELMIWALGGMTFAGWLGFGWGAVRYVRKQVHSFVQEQVQQEYPELVQRKLKEMMRDDSKELTDLIERKSFEYRIREEMAFPVVCAREDLDTARNLIQGTLGFKKAWFQTLEDFRDTGGEKMVVIYDLKNRLLNGRENEVQTILADAKQRGGETIYVVALQGQWQALNLYRTIANAANSPFTLYTRMMESLSFAALKASK